MRQHLFVSILVFLWLEVAFSAVDMRVANYSDTWIDLKLPGHGYDLKVERTYNSRSLFNGMFGFGWCSNFETVLEVTPEDTLKVKECGDGQSFTYTKKGFGKQQQTKLVNQIIAKYKAENPSVTRVSALKSQLLVDAIKRAEYAKNLGISSNVPTGTIYYSLSDQTETIKKLKSYYERTLSSGSKQRFSNKGRLTHIYDAHGNYLKLRYSRSRLTQVIDNTGRQLSISHYPSGKIKKIIGPNRMVASYKFSNVSNLSSNTSAWGNTYRYKYDKLRNLTRIEYPDKTFKALTYNTDKDWVTSFQSRDKCKETYAYKFNKSNPKNHYWANVKRRCGKKTTTTARFEFEYKKRKKLVGKYLHRTKTVINGRVNEIVYSEQFGKPILVTENGQTTKFEYFKSGLVRKRTAGKEIMQFKYNTTHNKVSQVKVGKKNISFLYNKKGNLRLVSSSTGERVKLTYDRQGRITSLYDQAKRLVKIKYDNQFGKPAHIERPGIGSIQVSYRPNGEIKNVTSKKGAATVVQVASVFNSLLDIVAPAGVDLKI